MSSRSSVSFEGDETEESDSAMLMNPQLQDPTSQNPFKDSYNYVYWVFLLCKFFGHRYELSIFHEL